MLLSQLAWGIMVMKREKNNCVNFLKQCQEKRT